MRKSPSSRETEPRDDENAAGTPSRAFLQGFANGLQVISSFGPQATAMTLAEVARRNGLTRAAARRILLTMQALGYVEARGRAFQLRAKVLDLGYAYLSSVTWLNIAQPVVEEIVAKTHMPCNGSVLDNHDIIYVLRVSTRIENRADLAISIGRRFPAYLTAMGRVLLGGLSPEDLDRYLENAELVAPTPRAIVAPDALRERIEQDRARGWSFVDQEHATGICSLGVPLHDARGQIFAALGIGWLLTNETPVRTRDRALPFLLEGAADISRSLRARGASVEI
jgi:IclR family pca regulon transcriptional regulator